MATFSNDVVSLAQQVQDKWGVPASLVLAQYSLESANGTSGLARNNNNYFGMKAVGGGWRKFDSMADSFDAYGELLNKQTYTKTGWKSETSVLGVISDIQPVYAPTSDGNAGYTQKIMNIINSNNLTQYDDKSKWGTSDSSLSISGGTSSTGVLGIDGSGILSKLVTAIAVVGVCILAFVFLMQSLNIDIAKVVA